MSSRWWGAHPSMIADYIALFSRDSSRNQWKLMCSNSMSCQVPSIEHHVHFHVPAWSQAITNGKGKTKAIENQWQYDTHIHTHTHTLCTHASTHQRLCVPAHTYTHTNHDAHTHTHTHKYKHARMHTRASACARAHTHTPLINSSRPSNTIKYLRDMIDCYSQFCCWQILSTLGHKFDFFFPDSQAACVWRKSFWSYPGFLVKQLTMAFKQGEISSHVWAEKR